MRKPQQHKLHYVGLYSAMLLIMLLAMTGCTSARHAFNPVKTYPKNKLQADYRLFRNILEESHPSLYWYTSKDSLDYYFDEGYRRIADSMTEPQFRTLLSYVIARIDCGHTSIRYSKAYAEYMDTARLAQFPLGLKFWDDTAAIYSNLNRRDSLLTRGTVVTAIDGMPITQVRDSLFRFMVTDGYSINHKYQTLSNLGNFGLLYQSVFGYKDQLQISYLDRQGVEQSTTVKPFSISKDTAYRRFLAAQGKPTKKQAHRNRLFNTRSLQVDTSGSTAFMIVSTFTNGNKLKSFFRQSFKYLDRAGIKNLVIDVRTNGGGNVGLSTKLTQYIVDHRFKIADTLYAVKKMSKYERHIQNSFA
ncbi:MAG TPA: S41 family peptidase, partial [Chitinophagaceae bacterium]|nr:S41 family peptidase [Chitinophagaceae bacterium]